MSRNLSAGLQTAFQSSRFAPVIFVEAQFLSGWVRVWSGVGSIVWNGSTWLGIQTPNGEMLGAISRLQERSDVQAMAGGFSLSGIPVTAVQQVINECRANLPANIYIGAVDLNTGALLDTPYKSWGGTMDVPAIKDDGATITVAISVETKLIDLQRAPGWTYEHEDQQILSPGDNGFIFVPGLQNLVTVWGQGNSAIPNGNAGSGLGIVPTHGPALNSL